MDSMDFQLRLKPIMDVSDISGSVQQLQQYLNKLNLPPKLKGEFKSTFIEVENKVASIQQKLDSGFKTKGDVTGLEKEFKSLDVLFKQFSSKLQGLDASKFKGITFNTPEIKEAKQQIAALQEQLNKQLPTDMMDKVSQSIKALGVNLKTETSMVKSFYSALQSGNVQEAADQLATLKNRVKETSDSSAELKNMTTLLDQLKNSGVVKTTEDLRTMEQVLLNLKTEELNKLQQRLLQGADGAEQLRQGIRGVGEQSRASANDMYSMTNQMDQLKNRVQYFFSLTNSVMLFRRALRSAFNSVKELDTAMKETAVVTDFSIDDMWKTLPQRTEDAKKLGVAIKDVYEARTLYYQQGLKTAEVDQLSSKTLQLARIAGLEAADATDRMTSALRGFNMELNETSATRVADVYANLAAKTASDTDEISNAMSKTASIAANAGMEFETTSAFLAQMIETTREAPENLGTAMKTIIARFTEMKKSPTDVFTDLEGEEVDVNKVDAALRSVGVSLKDVNGQFRDADDVFLELAEKWDTLDKNTQRYVATTAAGSRQQSRFIAMMSNYERTMELVGYANNSAGAAQKQYEKTLDSLETKLQNLKNAWQQFITTIANSELIKIGIDMLTFVLEIVNKFIDILPDGTEALGAFLLAFVAFKGLGTLFNTGMASIFALANPLMSTSGYQHGVMYGLAFNKGAKSTGMPIGGTPNVKGGAKGSNAGLLRTMIRSGKQSKTGFWSGTKQGYNSWVYGGKQDINGRWHDINTGRFMKTGKGKKPALTAKAASVSKIGGIASTIAGTARGTSIVKKGFNDTIDTSEEKISRYNEVLSELNGLIQENQSLFDNYDSAKDSYEEMTTKLDSLTSGTADWTQALMEVNDQNKQILAKYPELIKYTKELNGATVLTEEGWIQYNSLLQENLVNQRTAAAGMEVATMAEEHRNRAGNIVDTKDITNEEYKNIDTAATVGGVVGGGLGGWALGSAIGSVIPVFGTIIGGLIGGFAGALVGGGAAGGMAENLASNGITSEQASEAARIAQSRSFSAETATESETSEFIKSLEDAGIATDSFKEAIENNAVEFDEFVTSTAEYDIAAEAQRDATISEIASTIPELQDEENKGLSSLITTLVDTTHDDYDKKVQEYYDSLDLSTEELKAQYGDLMELTSDEINAKLEDKSLSEETMRQAIAANKATEDLTTVMKGLVTVFEDLKEKASKTNEGEKTENAKLATAIMHALSNNGKSMSQSDITIFDQLLDSTGTGYQTVTGLSTAYQEGDITDEQLTEYLNGILSEVGYSFEKIGISAKDLLLNLTTADNLTRDLINRYGQQPVDQANATMVQDTLGTSGASYSIGAQDTVAKAFSRGVDGSGADEVIYSIFTDLGKQVTESTVDQYNNLLENLDVTDSSSIEDTMKALEDLGFDVENFAGELKDATNATRELTNEQRQNKITTAESAYGVLAEKTDNIFTSEEKDALVSAGIDDDDDFVRIGEDFVYLGGTINDLRIAIEKNTKAQLGDSYKNDKNILGVKNEKATADTAIANIPSLIPNTTSSSNSNPFFTSSKNTSSSNPFFTSSKNTSSSNPFSFSSDTVKSAPSFATNIDEIEAAQTAAIKPIKDFLIATGEYLEKDLKGLSYIDLRSKYDELTTGDGAYSSEKIKEEEKTQDASYFATEAKGGNASRVMNDISAEVSLGDKGNQTYIDNMTKGLMAYMDTLGMTQKEMDEYTKALKSNDAATRNQAKAELEYFETLKKQEKAIERNKDKISSYTDQLNNSKKGTTEYQQGIEGITDSMNDIMDTNVDWTFFGESEDNMELFNEAIGGSEEAWEELYLKMQEESLAKEYGFQANQMQQITTALDGLSFDADANLYTGNFDASILKMFKSGKQAARFFKKLGFTNITFKLKDKNGKPLKLKNMSKEDLANVDGATFRAAATDIPAINYQNYDTPGDSGGGGGGDKTEHKNSKKSWQFNRDKKIEKRSNRIADVEHKIAMEQTKQIPNLKTLNKLNAKSLKLKQAQIKASKNNIKAADREQKRLWKQAKNKGWDKFINKDGTVNKKKYDDYNWGTGEKAKKAKEEFDQFESDFTNINEYARSEKERVQNLKKEVAEAKRFKKEYSKIANLSKKIEGSQNKMTQLQSKLNIELNKTGGSLTKALAIIKEQTKELKKQQKYQNNLYKSNKQIAKSKLKKSGMGKYFTNVDYTSGMAKVNYKQLAKDFKNKDSYNAAIDIIDDILEYVAASGSAYTESLSIEEQLATKKNIEEVYTLVTNLLLQIESSQQELNKLQFDYNYLLETGVSSAGVLFTLIKKQNKELERQKKLNKDIITDSKILAQKELSNTDVGKYVKSFDLETGYYQIDYEQIKKDAGGDSDAYTAIISGLDLFIKYMGHISDSNASLLDIEQQELDNYASQQHTTFSLIDRISKALENRAKATINEMKQIDGDLQDLNSEVVGAIRQNIQEQRQLRNNADKEEDLADKQARLAYLKQYSGGGNAVEIAKLEEEIAKGEESYTDALIDQKISALEKQNKEASEQRKRQIAIMEKQSDIMLKNGDFNALAMILISQMTDSNGNIKIDSEAFQVLYDEDNVMNMSVEQAATWFNDLSSDTAQMLQYLADDRTVELTDNWKELINQHNASLVSDINNSSSMIDTTISGAGTTIKEGFGAGIASLSDLFSGNQKVYNTELNNIEKNLSGILTGIETLVRLDLNNDTVIGAPNSTESPTETESSTGSTETGVNNGFNATAPINPNNIEDLTIPSTPVSEEEPAEEEKLNPAKAGQTFTTVTTTSGGAYTVGQDWYSGSNYLGKIMSLTSNADGTITFRAAKQGANGFVSYSDYTYTGYDDGTIDTSKGYRVSESGYGSFDGFNNPAVDEFVTINESAIPAGYYGYNGTHGTFKISNIDWKNQKVTLVDGGSRAGFETSFSDVKFSNLTAPTWINPGNIIPRNENFWLKIEKGAYFKFNKKKNDGTWQGWEWGKDAKNPEKVRTMAETGPLIFVKQNSTGDMIYKNQDDTYRFIQPNSKMVQYKTGGLADFTGPAWLDGTKTKPEIILNQKDTENFIQLRNILADIMKGVPSKSNQNNGDSYAEIHINVEKMTSDYDVDQVAKRVKKILNEDGRYRTVNQINRLR